MTELDFIEMIEENLSIRVNEIVHLKNIYTNSMAREKNILLKTGILLIYSHLEGFIKDSLNELVHFLNNRNEIIKNVNCSLQALVLFKEFNNLENLSNSKGIFKDEFRGKKHLLRTERRTHFLKEIPNLNNKKLKLDDKVVNLESNVGYEVLERNFYKFEIPTINLENFQRDMNYILNKRNSIAHNGLTEIAISSEEYEKYLRTSRKILEAVVSNLKSYVLRKLYLHESLQTS